MPETLKKEAAKNNSKKKRLKRKLKKVAKSINSMRKELLSLKSDTNTLLNNNYTSEQK